MFSTSNGGIFHQPFYLQPDEYKIDFATIQSYESKGNENEEHQSCLLTLNDIKYFAYLHFAIHHHILSLHPKHDMINESDGETKQGMVNQSDGGTNLFKQNMINQDDKISNYLDHDIGSMAPSVSSSALPCEVVKIMSSSAPNGNPFSLNHFLKDGSISVFLEAGNVHDKGIPSLVIMGDIILWLGSVQCAMYEYHTLEKPVFLLMRQYRLGADQCFSVFLRVFSELFQDEMTL